MGFWDLILHILWSDFMKNIMTNIHCIYKKGQWSFCWTLLCKLYSMWFIIHELTCILYLSYCLNVGCFWQVTILFKWIVYICCGIWIRNFKGKHSPWNTLNIIRLKHICSTFSESAAKFLLFLYEKLVVLICFSYNNISLVVLIQN